MTIGHSNMPLEEFIGRCKRDHITTVIDIRSHPTSKWPQFRKEEMERWLPDAGIGYEHEPGLGGWDVRHMPVAEEMARYGVDVAAYSRGAFPKQRIGRNRPSPDEGPSWTNQGLYDYAWFTVLPEFRNAAHRLVTRVGAAELDRPAVMCAESLWWKCHRSMVADYLVAVLGWPVIHVQPRLTSHAEALGSRIQRYPAEVRYEWGLRLLSVRHQVWFNGTVGPDRPVPPVQEAEDGRHYLGDLEGPRPRR